MFLWLGSWVSGQLTVIEMLNSSLFEFSRNTQSWQLFLAKGLPPVGFEPATPTPWYFHPHGYPSVLNPQELIEGSLTQFCL